MKVKTNKYVFNNDLIYVYNKDDELLFFTNAKLYDKIKEHQWHKANEYCSDIIDGKRVYAHRFIFEYSGGLKLDHINGNTQDNTLQNLRVCNNHQNGYNRRTQKNNKSGKNGVSYNKARNKWLVHIRHNGLREYLGAYENLEDAIKVREEAEKKYHKDFVR